MRKILLGFAVSLGALVAINWAVYRNTVRVLERLNRLLYFHDTLSNLDGVASRLRAAKAAAPRAHATDPVRQLSGIVEREKSRRRDPSNAAVDREWSKAAAEISRRARQEAGAGLFPSLERMRSSEKRMLLRQLTETSSQTWSTLLAISSGAAFSLLLFGVVFYFLWRSLRARQTAESSMRESRQMLDAFLQNSSAILYAKDLEGRYLLINARNPEATALYGGNPIGKKDEEIFPTETAQMLKNHDRLVLESKNSLEFEECVPLPQGTRTFLSIKFPILAPHGAPYAIGGIATNITERKRTEEILRKNEEQLRQVQKMGALGRLASGIAHDFNNLITAIIGYANFALNQTPFHDPRHDDILEIKKAGERAISLTRQLLAFSRKQILQPKVLNLNAVIANLEPMLRRLLGEDVRLTLSLDSNLSPVKIDLSQIDQVLMNLIVNARDAMPRGGDIAITTSRIDLNRDGASEKSEDLPPGAYAVLTISDTGCGMDAEMKSRLFEPFFSNKGSHGTGLGLWTVHGIVLQSHGTILVQSEPGAGTVFKLYFPCASPEPIPIDEAETRWIPTGGSGRILLVEDESSVRKLTARMLKEFGYTIHEARNATEALEICKGESIPPDLVLIDVVLPELSGPETVRRIEELFPRIPILYMSGYPDDVLAKHGITQMGQAFVRKPFDSTSILQCIQTSLKTAKT